MNAPSNIHDMFGSLLLSSCVDQIQAIGGAGVSRFISTSRTDKEIVAFLNHVFYEGADLGASDIHFQDDEYGTTVRYRIAGELHDIHRVTRNTAHEIDLKIRSRCQMSQQDRETSFDGSFWLDMGTMMLDVRVSVMPTRLGQSIVCRLLDQRNAARRLTDIEMQPLVRAALLEALRAPEGIVLVTGPTGSGKTSTLYACLNELNTRSVHIVTAEDPVEYRLPGADQVSVHPSRSFSQILRAFLRQDFDIGLVGEIRDAETAETAYQAGNTGHLILSTLHTNDTLSIPSRLGDLGIDAYTVASATKCALAQRLPKRLCPHCKIPHVLDDVENHILDTMKYDGPRSFWAHDPHGCTECRGGERGVAPVIELLVFDRAVREALIDGDMEAVKRAALAQPQYKPISKAVMEMSAQGIISFSRAIAMGAH